MGAKSKQIDAHYRQTSVSERPLTPLVNALMNTAHYLELVKKSGGFASALYSQFHDACNSLDTNVEWIPLDSISQSTSTSTQESDPRSQSHSRASTSATIPDYSNVSADTLLKVQCHFLPNDTSGDVRCREGLPIRPTVYSSRIGPLNLLFRWYAKRDSGQGPNAPGAPRQPQDNPFSLHGKVTTMNRRLNRDPDPVMNLQEVVELLEDFDIVPQWIRRSDVALAFNASLEALKDLLPKQGGQMRPDAARFPHFADILIRIALACRPPNRQEQDDPDGRLRLAALTEALVANNAHTSHLQVKLDELSRCASLAGPRKRELKWAYVAVEASLVPDNKAIQVGGWTALTLTGAPKHLMDELMQHDLEGPPGSANDWLQFPWLAIDFGDVGPGQTSHARIMLRTIVPGLVSCHVDITGAPFLSLIEQNTRPIPPGVPHLIDLFFTLSTPEEVLGEVKVVLTAKKLGLRALCLRVPVYGRCKEGAQQRDPRAPLENSYTQWRSTTI